AIAVNILRKSYGLMEPFRKYLHTYLSFRLLKKLKSTQVIHQLTLTDDPDLRQTFFYKLCNREMLKNFRNIILLSSPQVLLTLPNGSKNRFRPQLGLSQNDFFLKKI
ncbi:unnamed protein product, partial [Brassica rapa subsp. narinosa]